MNRIRVMRFNETQHTWKQKSIREEGNEVLILFRGKVYDGKEWLQECPIHDGHYTIRSGDRHIMDLPEVKIGK